MLRPASVCACNCVSKNISNHQPAELFIYGCSLKRAMKKLKGLGESIHFWNRLSADTTEESTAEGMRKCPLNQCCVPPLPVEPVAAPRTVRRDRTWVAREPT